MAQYEGPAFNPEQPCLLYDEFDVENKEDYHAYHVSNQNSITPSPSGTKIKISELDILCIMCNEFKRLSIPLVRRVYPQLIADKLVSVQPLSGPSSSGDLAEPDIPKKTRKKIWRSIDDPWELPE